MIQTLILIHYLDLITRDHLMETLGHIMELRGCVA